MRKKGDKVAAAAPPPEGGLRGRDLFAAWNEIHDAMDYNMLVGRGRDRAPEIRNPFAYAERHIPEPEDDADGGW